jgi:hypothetical protein
MKSSS